MFDFIPKEKKKKLRNVTVLIIYAIFSFWFLINGQELLPGWNESWTYTTIIYMVGVALFLSIQEKLPEELQSSIFKNIIGFCFAFPITIIILIMIRDSGYYFQEVTQKPIYLIPATLTYQLVIVSASEEIVFRGVIFRFLYQYNRYIGWFGSSLAFSLFHFAVYQGNISSLVFAFIMGLILVICADRWNLGVAMAIHWAWNIFILGAIVTFI